MEACALGPSDAINWRSKKDPGVRVLALTVGFPVDDFVGDGLRRSKRFNLPEPIATANETTKNISSSATRYKGGVLHSKALQARVHVQVWKKRC